MLWNVVAIFAENDLQVSFFIVHFPAVKYVVDHQGTTAHSSTRTTSSSSSSISSSEESDDNHDIVVRASAIMKVAVNAALAEIIEEENYSVLISRSQMKRLVSRSSTKQSWRPSTAT